MSKIVGQSGKLGISFHLPLGLMLNNILKTLVVFTFDPIDQFR
jgi:hypothetical protein